MCLAKVDTCHQLRMGLDRVIMESLAMARIMDELLLSTFCLLCAGAEGVGGI